MKKIIFVSILVCIGAAGAQEPTDSRDATVDQRQENQEQRIEQGKKSGALTDREPRRLERKQKRIEKFEARAMKDGKMSPREFRKTQRMQNQANREIGRKKHNARRK